jgi:hypothetical protein
VNRKEVALVLNDHAGAKKSCFDAAHKYATAGDRPWTPSK